MVRKWICGVLALWLVAAMAAPARAGDQRGSIRVTLQNGESVVPDGAVALYRAGTGVDGEYWLTEEFGGGAVRKEDAMSPALAAWLAEMAESGGDERLLDADGSAEFSNLPEGLYLVVQTEISTGYHRMEPMTMMLPCENQWHIQAYPKTEEIVWENPATGDSPLPALGAVGMALSGMGLLLCALKKRKRG